MILPNYFVTKQLIPPILLPCQYISCLNHHYEKANTAGYRYPAIRSFC
jgi:hypothetical protein